MKALSKEAPEIKRPIATMVGGVRCHVREEHGAFCFQASEETGVCPIWIYVGSDGSYLVDVGSVRCRFWEREWWHQRLGGSTRGFKHVDDAIGYVGKLLGRQQSASKVRAFARFALRTRLIADGTRDED